MLRLIIVILYLAVCVFGKPFISVIANVRGRKFDVKAATVGDFVSQVEKLAGLAPGQQSVLFRGKLLSSNEVLSDVGVSNGDVLNVLKGRKLPHKPAVFKDRSSPVKPVKADPFPSGLPQGLSEDTMKNAMKSMEAMLDSNFIEEYFADDTKLEAARLQLLNNIDEYDKMMPGFREQAEDIASSPEKWREAMEKAREQIKQMRKMRDSKKAGDSAKPAKKPAPKIVEEPKDDSSAEDSDD